MADLLRFHWILLLLAAPCVGSFLGVLTVRLPQERPVLWSRSACPHCGQRLGARDLIPIVSWALSRGACRFCGRRLSWFYPAIEIAALIVAVWSLALVPGWLAWASCGLGWALLALAVIDARDLILPDELTLPLIPAGLAVTWALDPDRLLHHAAGAVGAYLLVVGLRLVYRRVRRRDGIGMGDAKLLAAAGAWLGWAGLPSVLFVAAAGALLGHVLWAWARGHGLRDRELPFGPYLAGAIWLTWLYGPVVVSLP